MIFVIIFLVVATLGSLLDLHTDGGFSSQPKRRRRRARQSTQTQNRARTSSTEVAYVYIIKNKVTGESYVGCTNNYKRRWNQHRNNAITNREPNKLLYKNMRKHGVNNFHFEVIAKTTEGNKFRAERFYINQYKPTLNMK